MSLQKKLYKASMLATGIKSTGIMDCSSGDNKRNYQEAAFQGSIHSVVGGVNNIDAGLCGIMNVDGIKALVISFRGTNGTLYDWMNNFTCAFVDYKNHGRVHKGFLESVQSVFSEIVKQATMLAANTKVDKFYLTGHSKGGAMATLMAVELENSPLSNVPKPEVMTYGAPRVGDAAFVKSYPAAHLRYESCRDIVPHVPFTAQEASLILGLDLPIYTQTVNSEPSLSASPADYIKKLIAIFDSLAQGNLAQFEPLGKLISIIPNGEPQALGESTRETLHTLYHTMTRYVVKRNFSQVGDAHIEDYKNYFNNLT